MRIAQVANFVGPRTGGASRVMKSLRAEYRSRGFEVLEMVPRSGVPSFDGDTNRAVMSRAVPLPFSGGYRVMVGRQALTRCLRKFQPDLVEISDLSTLTWVARWCAENGVECSVIAHERMDSAIARVPVAGPMLKPLAERWRRTVEDHADRIVCPSEFAAQQFRCQDKVVIRPWGVDHSVFHPQESPREWNENPRALVVSRLSKEKSPHVTIDFALNLVEARGGLVTVIGDGPLARHLREKFADRPVVFEGHVADRWEVARAMRHSDLLVNLGTVETFGLVTLEAMACGTPVVVRDCGGSAELVESSFGWRVGESEIRDRSFAETVFARSRSTMSRDAAHRAADSSWSRVADVVLGSEVVVGAG